MRHAEAKKNDSGNNTISPESLGKTDSFPGRKLRGSVVKTEGRGGNNKRSQEFNSGFRFADGFLKTKFVSRKNSVIVPEGENTEVELIRSLNLLCDYYGINVPEISGIPFPENITKAMIDLRNVFMNHKHRNDIDLDVRESSFVSIERNTDTGSTVFYIGVQEVYDYSKKHPEAADILTDIFCYLYYDVDIDYHADEGSFLFYKYEGYRDMLSMEDEEAHEFEHEGNFEYHKNRVLELEVADEVSKIMLKKIHDKKNNFDILNSLQKFNPITELNKRIEKIGYEFLNLMISFPKQSMFINTGIEIDTSDYDEESEYHNTSSLNKTIHFVHCADAKSHLFDVIFDSANMSLQECYINDYPTIIRKFSDASDYLDPSLYFENKLMELLSDLIQIIEDLPNNDTLPVLLLKA